MPKKLKIAFIGGSIHSAIGRVHKIAAEMDQRMELIAGCFSRSPDINRESALAYGLPVERAYPSVGELLISEGSELDAAVVITPQDQHHQQILALLDAGIPVISEKALVAQAFEADNIRQRVLKDKQFLAVTYNYTGYPMVRELRRMIQSGWLGDVQQILIEMPQEGFARVSPAGDPIVPQAWRLRDGPIPTLSLDLGVHIHMMLRFLVGQPPEEVIAVSSSRGNFPQVTDTVHCLARLRGEIDCSIWYGKTALGYRNGLRMRVIGNKGAAEWVQENPENLLFADNMGGKLSLDRTSKGVVVANEYRYQRFKAGHPAGFIEAFANYYYDLANNIAEYYRSNSNASNEYVFGADESLEGLRMLEAIQRSSITRKWEPVIS